MATVRPSKTRWHTNASAVKGYVKKPKGFEAWFYTGPTLHFGHIQKPKRKK